MAGPVATIEEQGGLQALVYVSTAVELLSDDVIAHLLARACDRITA